MNVTWEMVGGFITVIVALFAGFKWIAKKFDRLAERVGKLDKKKVSHKTCVARRAECPCVTALSRKEG